MKPARVQGRRRRRTETKTAKPPALGRGGRSPCTGIAGSSGVKPDSPRSIAGGRSDKRGHGASLLAREAPSELAGGVLNSLENPLQMAHFGYPEILSGEERRRALTGENDRVGGSVGLGSGPGPPSL